MTLSNWIVRIKFNALVSDSVLIILIWIHVVTLLLGFDNESKLFESVFHKIFFYHINMFSLFLLLKLSCITSHYCFSYFSHKWNKHIASIISNFSSDNILWFTVTMYFVAVFTSITSILFLDFLLTFRTS
jgi:hypothetical protein